MKIPTVRTRHRGDNYEANQVTGGFFAEDLFAKGTASSIAASAESWVKEEEKSIPLGHRLMQSPLTQRVVRDLISWSWDTSLALCDYVSDSQVEAMRLLKVLGDQSVTDLCAWDELDGGVSNFHSLNSDELSLVVRSLVELIEDVFEYFLFDLVWPYTERSFDDMTRKVRSVNEKIREKFHWLGEILDDLGEVMAPDGEVPASEHDTEPSICLDQFRIRSEGSVH